MTEAQIRGSPASAMAESQIRGSPASAMAESGKNYVVNKVYSELNSKLGLFDNEFAEFVVNLGRNCSTLEEFGDKLKELGIHMPNYVVYSLFIKIYEDTGVSKSDLELAIRLSIEDYVIRERRQNLPIYSVKDDLIRAVNDNRVLVVSGGVGSGKTTQITQYLVESGYASHGRVIGCTQPHVEFVESVAIRVAEEYGCELGQQVGYATTLEDNSSESTLIKYMTVDVLLRELLEDRYLSKYSVIVIDEADARTAFTDLLIAVLNNFVLRTNHDLRLVVVTSPLDCYLQNLTGFLSYSRVFTIPTTTTYPVDIVYLDEKPIHRLVPAMETIYRIIVEETPGDILLFWGYDTEIERLVSYIHGMVNMNQAHITRDLVILTVDRPLDSSVFEPAPPGKRKLLIASTRFSEVCLSINGIRYVIDLGDASLAVFDPNEDLYLSGRNPISQESAMQRALLAGRVDQGKCFRLYTREFYRDQMPPTYPEIERLNLCSMMLFVEALGIRDIFSVFMDPPPAQALTCATKCLYALGALDERGHLTQLGRKMAAFPMDPPLSKMLMASVDLGCSDEILTIISMIQTKATYIPPMMKHKQLAKKRSKFKQPEGDMLTMLAIFEDGKAHNFSEQWCEESCICPGLIRKALVAKNRLVKLLKEKWELEVVSGEGNSLKIREAIASGLFLNAAKKDGKGGWMLVDERHASYSKSKFILGGGYSVAERVVALSVLGEIMQVITVVDPQWLPAT